MRELQFRAQRIDNGEWTTGYYWRGSDHVYIIPSMYGVGYDEKTKFIHAYAVEVDPETFCEFTGFEDNNLRMIYENDILKVKENNVRSTYQNGVHVRYDNWINEYTFRVDYTPGSLMQVQRFVNDPNIECEVIGNVFDRFSYTD